MTSPDAPPPSSSPPTTREAPPAHRRREGGLDPDPPDPGILRGVPPHAFLVGGAALLLVVAGHDVLLLAVSLLLLVAAWESWLLARLDARHRPVAIGLVAMALCMLVREVLHASVLRGGPYAGWERVAFHLEEGARLATAALPAWMALATLSKRWPPGPTAWALGAIYGAAWVGLAAGYPELRGDALRRVYLGAELAALLVAVAAILSWVRRHGWRPVVLGRVTSTTSPIQFATRGPLQIDPARWHTWVPILALVVGDLLLLAVGAWGWGLFGPAYVVQQGGLLAVWGVVAALQGAALVMARRRG